MTERRRGLGRGLQALIPPSPRGTEVTIGDGATMSPAGVPVLTEDRNSALATSLPDEDAAPAPAAGGPDPAGPGTAGPTGPQAAAPEVPATVAGAYFAELPLDSIRGNPRQPRKVFDEDALTELITSIKEVGLLQPVVVRQVGAGQYELIMGERRWRACREAGLDAIPAIVRATEDDKMLLDALLENLHRAQLNPLEEAAAYDQLLRDFKCTHDELADRVGRSRSQVTNTIRLLKLSPQVQPRVAAGVLSAGHARALLSVEDPEEQERLARRIVAEGLSVRAVEEIVKFQTTDAKPARRRPRAGRLVSPALDELAGRLSDRFDTRVKVDLGKEKGKIVVEFASMEDLQRILDQLAPGEGPVLQRSRETDEEAD